MSDTPAILTLEERLERAQREMRALERANRALQEPRDRHALCQEICASASDRLDVDAAYIALSMADDNYLKTIYTVDKGVEYPPETEPWSINPHGPIAATINTQRPVRFDDLNAEMPDRFPQVDLSSGRFGDTADQTRSWLMVPIIQDGRVRGVLNVQSYQPARYGPAEEHFLATLGHILAMGLQQGELLERLGQTRKALSVPLIPLSDTHLMLPLVGRIDSERLQLIQEIALHSVQGTKIRTVIIVLSAVHYISDDGPRAIIRLVQTLELLGVRSIITNNAPQLSMRFLDAGIDVNKLTIAPTVVQAFALAGLRT